MVYPQNAATYVFLRINFTYLWQCKKIAPQLLLHQPPRGKTTTIMRTYILADNQDISREGLISIINSEHNSPTIFVAHTCDELQQTLNIAPNSVVVVDPRRLETTAALLQIYASASARQSSWLVFSDNVDKAFVKQLQQTDSSVCVATKNDTRRTIANAIAAATDGTTFLCDNALSAIDAAAQTPQSHQLTATEKIVLREIALGKMTKEIAIEKNLSFHTINTHRRNIFRKLKINNVHEATKYALKAGLIDLIEYYI